MAEVTNGIWVPIVQSWMMLESRFSAFLDALGIDVWIRRGESPEQTVQVDTALVDSKNLVDEFSVRGFRLGAVLALVDESVWGHRRFFLDVAWAMNEFNHSHRDDIRFDWPELGASVGTQDPVGLAFRTFLENQLEGDMSLLMVGERVAKLVGTNLKNIRHVYLDGPLRDGAEKKQLWQQILKMR